MCMRICRPWRETNARRRLNLAALVASVGKNLQIVKSMVVPTLALSQSLNHVRESHGLNIFFGRRHETQAKKSAVADDEWATQRSGKDSLNMER